VRLAVDRDAPKSRGEIMKRTIAAACTLLLACASVPTKRVARGNFDPSARDEVWARTTRSLQEHGFIIQTSDYAGGVIATQTMRGPNFACGFLNLRQCPTRVVIQVMLSRNGEASANILRERFVDNDWRGPDTDEAVQGAEREEAALLAEIIGPHGSVRPSVEPAGYYLSK
jgi:hypothetical protein